MWKIIVQELKTNISATTDAEGEELSYNKVDEALRSVGISLIDANGQFRDQQDIFLELSKIWSTLDRNSQRYQPTPIFDIKGLPFYCIYYYMLLYTI